MGTNYSPRSVINGLVLNLDAANIKSYSGSGTAWSDLSGSNNNATLINGPTFSSSNNGIFVFDGTNDYAQVSGSLTLSQATFQAWVRRNGSQVVYAGVVFSRGDGLNVNGINIYNNNQLGYTWHAAVNTYSWNSGLVIPDLSWSMVSVSISASSAVAYLCTSLGITSSTNNVSHPSSVVNDIRVANDEFATRFFNGSMSQVRVYNRALSASEVKQNFNALRSRYGI